MSSKRILWIEDDLLSIYNVIEDVKDHGFEIITATTTTEAINILDKEKGNFFAIILDVRMSPGKEYTPEETRGGFITGIALGRTIKSKHPSIPIIGISVTSEPVVADWFEKHGFAYLLKPVIAVDLISYLNQINGKNISLSKRPKIFIVHGHDHGALYQLKNYIQCTLKLGEPKILREQPSYGRTIIEKFEKESRNVDIVFVMLTPDDMPAEYSHSNEVKRRARQNVIFELGYFFGKLQRKRGRVVLLHGGGLELPSDISGIVYIDISQGIESAGEAIRRELKDWIHKQ